MTLAPRRRQPLTPASGSPARAAIAALALAAGPLAALPGCGDGASPPEPEPCDQQCLDTSAIRALRETIKLAFNLTLQGKPVGAHDVTVPCPFGGSIRVYGEAYSNPIQGATEVTLTYELAGCAYKVLGHHQARVGKPRAPQEEGHRARTAREARRLGVEEEQVAR